MDTNTQPNIIDIEASGFGRSSYPIEIGVVTHENQRYCALIKPQLDWVHWCEQAEAVHGITQNTLKEHGKPAETVCKELNQILKGQHIFSDAWSHDARWLNTLFQSVNIQPCFSLRAIEHILKESQVNTWDQTKIRLQKQLKLQRHRASSDAYLIQQTYLETRLACCESTKKLA